MIKDSNGAGKGDTPRPVDYKKYCENWDACFNKKKVTYKPKPKSKLYGAKDDTTLKKDK